MDTSGKNRILYFKLITIALVIFFFLMIEITVRILIPDNQSQERLIDLGELNFFSKVNIKGEPSIQITNKYGYSDQHTIFKERKMPGTYRIFCIGGSASAGWPHPFNERFSTYLDTCLKKIYPGKQIEIINCSAHGFASYRVQKIFHQLIPYQPDAVIVWSGNNEFLEDDRFKVSNFQSGINWLAERIKTVQLVKKVLPVKKLDGNEIESTNSFWKKVQQQSLELCSDPKLSLKVKLGYTQSIESITKEAAQNGIKVFLFTVPVNLRDWQPNVSYSSLKGPDSLAWSQIYNSGRNSLFNSDYNTAKSYFMQVISKEPLHAMSYFLLARSQEGLRDTTEALANYVRAKDLDYNPFRAISDFNKSLRMIADSNPNISLFDAEKLFQKYGQHGIPGFDLFLDYVHPTRWGNLILASEFSEFIRERNLLAIQDSEIKIDTASLKGMLSDYNEENDITLQITRYSLCCLTHQYKSAVVFGNKILNSLPESYLNDKVNSNDVNKLRDGVKCFSNFLEVEKEVLKSGDKIQDLKSVNESVRQFYEVYFPYGTY